MRKEKGFTLIELMIVIAIIAIIAAIAIPGLLNSQRASNERNASGSLKTLGTAQSDFRSNDRDNNRIQDFWVGDVAGLYCIDNTNVLAGGVATPIKLIEVSIALADITVGGPGCTVTQPPGNNYAVAAAPTYGTMSAKAGYWYMALTADLQWGANTGTAGTYATNTGNTTEAKHNTSRFGVAAMYESYGSSGNKSFILNEGNTMFKRDFGADVLVVGGAPPPTLNVAVFDGNWPLDATLAANWGKMD
ncbi:MAG: DUF2950 family protein [Planctomycetes bacterium]|nr:DUF2950 family protein [Planctomycetota bacterium]